MRKRAHLLAIILVISAIAAGPVRAQTAGSDSSSQQTALNSTLSRFYASIGEQSRIYNGMEYYNSDPIIKGNAFYADVSAFTPGTIFYDGAKFDNVPMLYDIYNDKVVVL